MFSKQTRESLLPLTDNPTRHIFLKNNFSHIMFCNIEAITNFNLQLHSWEVYLTIKRFINDKVDRVYRL